MQKQHVMLTSIVFRTPGVLSYTEDILLIFESYNIHKILKCVSRLKLFIYILFYVSDIIICMFHINRYYKQDIKHIKGITPSHLN